MVTRSEAIERMAKAFAVDAGKDISDWDSTPDLFLNPWREKATVALDALLHYLDDCIVRLENLPRSGDEPAEGSG